METVLANKISDLIQSDTNTISQLTDAHEKIEAMTSIQAPISELEKRLNVKFDPKELDLKITELQKHIDKKK